MKMTGYIREKPQKIRLIQNVNRILTGIVFLAYPLFLFYLLWEKRSFLLRAVSVPACSFLAVTIFRKAVNMPRPYEKFGIPPVLKKDTKGKSFPSRHVFSVFILAMTVGYEFPLIGGLLGLIGIALGAIRVIGGVHEIKDVIAGALTGVICGIAGFYLL